MSGKDQDKKISQAPRYPTRYQRELAEVRKLEAEVEEIRQQVQDTEQKNADLKDWHRRWDQAVQSMGLDPTQYKSWGSGGQQ